MTGAAARMVSSLSLVELSTLLLDAVCRTEFIFKLLLTVSGTETRTAEASVISEETELLGAEGAELGTDADMFLSMVGD